MYKLTIIYLQYFQINFQLRLPHNSIQQSTIIDYLLKYKILPVNQQINNNSNLNVDNQHLQLKILSFFPQQNTNKINKIKKFKQLGINQQIQLSQQQNILLIIDSQNYNDVISYILSLNQQNNSQNGQINNNDGFQEQFVHQENTTIVQNKANPTTDTLKQKQPQIYTQNKQLNYNFSQQLAFQPQKQQQFFEQNQIDQQQQNPQKINQPRFTLNPKQKKKIKLRTSSKLNIFQPQSTQLSSSNIQRSTLRNYYKPATTQQNNPCHIKFILNGQIIQQKQAKFMQQIYSNAQNIYELYYDQQLTRKVNLRKIIALKDTIFYCKTISYKKIQNIQNIRQKESFQKLPQILQAIDKRNMNKVSFERSFNESQQEGFQAKTENNQIQSLQVVKKVNFRIHNTPSIQNKDNRNYNDRVNMPKNSIARISLQSHTPNKIFNIKKVRNIQYV